MAIQRTLGFQYRMFDRYLAILLCLVDSLIEIHPRATKQVRARTQVRTPPPSKDEFETSGAVCRSWLAASGFVGWPASGCGGTFRTCGARRFRSAGFCFAAFPELRHLFEVCAMLFQRFETPVYRFACPPAALHFILVPLRRQFVSLHRISGSIAPS
jgi:hypothetical protein